MVDRCLRPAGVDDAAFLKTWILLEQYTFPVEIQIMDGDPDMPGDGWLADLNHGMDYNIYELGGSASGHGTKGRWQNYDDPSFSPYGSSLGST